MFWLSVVYNFRLTAMHVPGVDNVLADKISRLHDPFPRHYLRVLLARTAPSTTRDEGGKYATGTHPDNVSSKIRGESNITIGKWNVRTLHAVGKMEELEHEMERYHWNILRLSETRWKNQWEQRLRKDIYVLLQWEGWQA